MSGVFARLLTIPVDDQRAIRMLVAGAGPPELTADTATALVVALVTDLPARLTQATDTTVTTHHN